LALTVDEVAARRARTLSAVRWCFLNVGFAKATFEDIARRASSSRTLLYRISRDKAEESEAAHDHCGRLGDGRARQKLRFGLKTICSLTARPQSSTFW
jgi:hypothetical protein